MPGSTAQAPTVLCLVPPGWNRPGLGARAPRAQLRSSGVCHEGLGEGWCSAAPGWTVPFFPSLVSHKHPAVLRALVKGSRPFLGPTSGQGLTQRPGCTPAHGALSLARGQPAHQRFPDAQSVPCAKGRITRESLGLNPDTQD